MKAVISPFSMRFLLLSAFLALAACGGDLGNPGEARGAESVQGAGTSDASGDKRTLKIGFTQYPSTMHPNIENMVAKSYVRGMVLRPMTLFDADWKLVCGLCTKLPTLENGMAELETTPDGKQGIAVRYELDPTATWGDGTPVTVKDILFAWEVGRHPQSGANNMEMYRKIYKIDEIDDKNLVFHMDKVSFDYNALGDLYPLPEHLERAVFEANPREYKNRTLYNADITNPGLWFGPYLIAEVATGSFLRLERNPHWGGHAPYFDTIVLRAVQNTSAMEANLLSGNIDMIAGELGLLMDQALSFEKRHGTKFNIIYKSGLLYEHIDLNLENPILADKQVRKALMYAMNREELNRKLFEGRQPVAHSSVSPLDNVASDNITKYSHDPAKAVALLEEAGWTDIRNGVRHNAAGAPLRLEVISTAGNKTRELVEQVLQSQLKQVGVDLRIRNEAPRVFFGQTTRERKFPAMAMFAWMSAPNNVPRSTLHSSEIPTEDNNYAGQNYTTISIAELDRIIDEIELELDAAKRLPMWERIQQIYSEELPVLPLYWRADPYILPHWLKGLVPTGHLDGSTNWVEYWRREA